MNQQKLCMHCWDGPCEHSWPIPQGEMGCWDFAFFGYCDAQSKRLERELNKVQETTGEKVDPLLAKHIAKTVVMEFLVPPPDQDWFADILKCEEEMDLLN